MIAIIPSRLRRQLSRSPRLLLHTLDFEKMEARFVHMTRRTFRVSSFLDQRIVTATPFELRVPLGDLIDDTSTAGQQSVCYVFHTAFCGSTLLARSLDHRRLCLPYKEPMALTQYCQSVSELPPEMRAELLSRIVRWLAKTFHAGETPLIKLSNLCSFVIAELLDSRPRPRGLFLYSDLRTFLCSILPSKARRAWVRKNLAITSCLAAPTGIAKDLDVMSLNDAEAASCLWLRQMHNYLQLVGKTGHDRVASLHCELFFGHPETALEAISEFFDLGFAGREIKRTVTGKVFDTYSKPVPEGRLGKILGRMGLYYGPAPQRFDKTQRAKILLAGESKYGSELAQGIDWVEDMTRHEQIPKILPQALME